MSASTLDKMYEKWNKKAAETKEAELMEGTQQMVLKPGGKGGALVTMALT